MNLSNLTREELEEIVKLQDEALRLISMGSTQHSVDASVTRAKVQKLIEEAGK